MIQDYVSLKKSGANYKGLCPFHGEKTPSFHVNRDKGFFHCFGCGAGGDVFKFLELHEKIGFPDAVKQLAQRFGVALPELEAERRAAGELGRARDAAQGARVGGRMVPRAARVATPARASAGRSPTAASPTRPAEALGLGFAPPARDGLKSRAPQAGLLAGRAAARRSASCSATTAGRSIGSATG